MEAVKPLENKIAEIHKGLPHLPEGFRSWLTENIWWITAIGLGLTILGALSTLQILTLGGSGLYSVYGQVGVYVGRLQTWLWLSLAISIIEAVLLATAIKPLRANMLKGWRLLFLVSLVNILSGILSIIIGGQLVSSLIGLAIGIAISWYLLFEIRDGFVKA